ncbi:hypothetical protein D9753_35645 [Streptomyces dangxiongensis]|uniref:Uncharacterized protein n=1 Tax=Streptomyces dangxiongensis TaxID=1442032 RepID=A0A3G2JPC4_9ACTN|nr:hypothetical protein D9753_35645 [Streptomyces dangxiongensis]
MHFPRGIRCERPASHRENLCDGKRSLSGQVTGVVVSRPTASSSAPEPGARPAPPQRRTRLLALPEAGWTLATVVLFGSPSRWISGTLFWLWPPGRRCTSRVTESRVGSAGMNPFAKPVDFPPQRSGSRRTPIDISLTRALPPEPRRRSVARSSATGTPRSSSSRSELRGRGPEPIRRSGCARL